MEKLESAKDIFIQSVANTSDKILAILPLILVAIFSIIIGYILARIVQSAVIKALNLLKFGKVLEKFKVSEYLAKMNIKRDPIKVIGRIAFWVIILFFTVGITETFGWTVVSEKIGNAIDFIPNILFAILILTVGLYLASFVRSLIRGAFQSFKITSGRIVSTVIYGVIVLFSLLTALEQIGINVDLVTANLTIFLGGITLALAIAYGLAAKDIMANLLSSFYNKNKYTQGQHLEIDGIEGKLDKIDNFSVVLNTKEGQVVIPTQKLNTSVIKIMDSE